MRNNKLVSINPSFSRTFLSIVLFFLAAAGVCAQSTENPARATDGQVAPSINTQVVTNENTKAVTPNAEEVQKRIERARALAAAHQLQTAASELEAIRRTAADDVLRNVTSIMLMGIYLEEGNYVRAETLLEENFQARATRKDASLRTYFAIAGQAMNGARSHLARYRTFGINIIDGSLPAEALSDLDRLRSLLERMVAQAKEIAVDRKAYDALALLEDVVGIRLSLARDSEDRVNWEREYASTRGALASSQTQIASLSGLPSLQRTSSKPPAEVAQFTKEPPATTAEPAANPTTTKNPSTAVQTTNSPSSMQKSEPPEAASTSNSKGNDEVRTVTTSLLNDRATKKVLPIYSSQAKSSGVQGVVRVHVAIDESGRVTGIFSSDGPILLRQSAEDAARNWRFPPTLVDGKPVRLIGYIEFNFTLPLDKSSQHTGE